MCDNEITKSVHIDRRRSFSVENVKIQDLFSFHFLSSLTLSPDKTRAALVVQKANGKDNDYDGDIYLYEIASGAVPVSYTHLPSGTTRPVVW